MFFFNRKSNKADKKYKWQPVVSNAQTVLRLFEDLFAIDVTLCRLIVKCNDIVYKVGIIGDDEYYINDKKYESYEEFKRATDIENTPFEELLENIYIIADKDYGDPREYPLLRDK